MTVFRTTPTYSQPLVIKNNLSSAWYRWFQNVDKGVAPSGENSVAVGASPWTYNAPSKGFLIVSGGTVSVISFARTPGVFYATGQTGGPFPLSQNDQLKVTFSLAPVAIWVPQ